jgi:hypothetical protein
LSVRIGTHLGAGTKQWAGSSTEVPVSINAIVANQGNAKGFGVRKNKGDQKQHAPLKTAN